MGFREDTEDQGSEDNPWEQLNWFDVKNIDHLKAWARLRRTGFWPKGFTDGKPLPHMWDYILKCRLADAYVDMMLEK